MEAGAEAAAAGGGVAAGGAGGAVQNQVAAAGRRRRTMRNYAASFTNPNIDNPTATGPVFGHTECLVYIGDQDATGNSNNLAFQLNFEAGKAEHVTSEEARAGHFLGCIINVFQGKRDELLRLASDAGYHFKIVRVPSGMAAEGVFEPTTRMHPGKQLAIFGYLVLMLFKQINENSYQNFTNNRLRALFAIAAYEVREDEDITVFQNIYHARTFRTIFGQNFGLRSKITKCVIEKQLMTTPLGCVCAYDCSILCWNEMTNLNFIIETLLVTKSPVLYQAELATEILNVERALKAVLSSPMPQLFRVLHPPHETQVLARNNFPRLAAIATKIKSGSEANASQFVTTMNTDEAKIDQYVLLHKSGMLGTSNANNVGHALGYLTNFDELDED